METKLRLKLDQDVIEKAKIYASQRKMNLSRIVESYLQAITSELKDDDFEISPDVRSISTGISIPANFDYKKEYIDHLDNKYK